MVQIPAVLMGSLLLGSSSFAAIVGIANKSGGGGMIFVQDNQIGKLSSNACKWLGGECRSQSKDGLNIQRLKNGGYIQTDGSYNQKSKNGSGAPQSTMKGAKKPVDNEAKKQDTKGTEKPVVKGAEKPVTKATEKPMPKRAEASVQKPATKVTTSATGKPSQKVPEKGIKWDLAVFIPAGQPARTLDSVADVFRKHGITVGKVVHKIEDMPKQGQRWVA
ncbi:hypothetical protein K461DRAFT_293035 [Myriangium duriaei CBS 260.36]|uniref:Uncharacterized protein n=1 Tax=Myriangium duriaei CBS 260.36 TaxID=1168546 RepID=A0A9P4MH55_9PEZI|nr:hypothetical protein K461DRAFT_293035 [Myriangium duriaei CBS 260.36]